MSISDIRQKYPQYGEVPDDVLVDSLYNKFYAGKVDRDEFNTKIGYSPEPVKGGSIAGWAKDLGLSALSGATWVPEAVIGLADLAANPKRRFVESWTGQEQETFTRGLAKMGVDFGRAQEVAADLKTDKAKQAREDVDAAFKEGGLLEGLKALGKNPSLALNAAVESMPSMLSLAGLTRLAALRIYAQAAKTAPAAEAAAAGKAAVEAAMPRLTAYAAMLEGGQVAGQTGSGFAQEGTLSGREVVSSIGAGATTAAIGQIANKVGSRIGLEDVEATLGAGVGSADNLLTRVAKGGFREGVLEEAPQSATETMWQNFGEEKPILEGSGQAMVEGLVVGGLLGTAAAGGTRRRDNTDEVINRIANEETVESAIDDLNETVDFTLRTVEPGEVLPVEPQGFSREAEIARLDDELRQALYRRDMAWQGKDSAEWQQARSDVAALQAEMEGVRGVEYTPGPIEPAPSLQVPDAPVTPEVVAPLLSKTGAPFKTERSASLSTTFRSTPGATVVPVEGGFGVQPPARELSLAPIDVGQAATMRAIEQAPSNQEWAAFPEESGTLSIPRAEMPQIKAEHRGAMTQFLKGRGIEHAAETVPADSLKPTQAEFSPAKVQSARDYEGGNRSILVSQDGYVVDGHHQWAASLGQDVDIIRINAPIQEVLQAAREFPSSTTAGDKPVLQNRDRSEPAYIEQMTSIAAAPDYSRLGFSRDFGNGAPVVEPGAVIPEEQMGATDRAVTTGGRRIPIQYAVVEADQLLPSNTADGSPVAEYEQGAEGMSRAIAGNGRVAGLKLAHQRGKTAEYVQGIIDDAGLHGISADVVQAMKQPVLVRIMPQDEVTADIGDVSNQAGQATLTGAEQAKNDARRVDLAGLSFSENGDITDTTVMQFIRAMPESERSGLMDGGRPGRKAIDRLESAVFATAYGSDTLVALQAQATDTEARTVMKGLLAAASKMARLSGQGEYDIRGLVIEAAEAAVNARRAGQSLSQFIQQEDMTRTPETQVFLEIFADNIRSAKRIGDQLSSIADKFYTEAVRPSSDMLGEVPRLSRAELLDSISGGRDARTESSSANAANTGEPERPADAERSGEAWDYEPTESGDTGSDPFALETQTEEDLAQQDAARRTAEQEEVEAQRRADADEQVDDFNLSGSDSVVDQAESRGQGNIFDSAPAKPKAKSRKGKAEEARQASRDTIGAKEGDVVTPSADIGYSEAGGSYRIDSIDSDGTVHVVDESNASRTSWDRADLAKAKRNGVTFERQPDGSADTEAARLRQLAGEFDFTYGGKTLEAVALDVANHAIDNGRRMTPAETEALADKHDIPVDVADQILRQPFSYEGLTEQASRGNEDAKALLARARQKRKEAEAELVLDPVPTPEPASTPAAIEQSPIEAFGDETLDLRRMRDKTGSLKRDLSDADIASMPLSKIWPKEELSAIEDPAIAAFATAARAEIPTKPRKPYAVKRWVEQVQTLRNFTLEYMEKDPARVMEKLRAIDGLRDFAAKVDLLSQVDRKDWGRVSSIALYPGAKRYGDNGTGDPIPSPFVQVTIDGKRHNFKGAKTAADVVQLVRKMLDQAAEPAAASKMKFTVRGKPGSYWIHKEGDPEYRKLREFDDSKKALAYVRENHSDLVEAWESVKERDNVKKADTRSVENQPRTGADHRQGRDVGIEEFHSTFGLRHVDWGKWVSDKGGERQAFLNDSYDALMDLAGIIELPPKALGLDGNLVVTFGKRGSGWAAAHFEAQGQIINLTRTKGAGSLAHEWFHAMDNYFQRQRGESRSAVRESSFITYSPETYYEHPRGDRIPATTFEEALEARRENRYYRVRISDPADWKKVEGVRPAVEASFAELVNVLDKSPMQKRSEAIDQGKGGYWSSIIERAARSFENYVIAKMEKDGYNNDFLANVISIDRFARNPERYPYLLENEMEPVEAAFGNLFGTIQTRNTERGVAMFSQLEAGSETQGMPIDKMRTMIAPALEILNQQEGIDVVVLQSVTDMPAEALGDVDPSVRYRGAYHNGTVYLFADNIESGRQAQVTLAHELVGHKGILAGATPEEWAEIRRQIESLLKLRSRTAMDIAAETTRRYSNYKEGSDNWMKEFLAVAAERREKRGRIGSIVAEVKAILRKWLRSLGLRGPFSDSDIELIMQNSERNLRARRGDQGMVDGGAPVMADSEGGSSTPASRDSITNTPAFKRWFGESKVVDADGNPQMMYHGTRSDFSQFRAGGRTRGLIFFTASRDQANRYAEGDGYGNLADFEDQVVFQLFEDENPDVAQGGRVLNPERLAEIAEGYDIPARGDTPAELARSYEAEYALVRDGGSVMPVYLSAQNPHPRMPWREAEKRGSRWFKERGYDGVWIEEEGENVLAVFDPTQIKSAIGNNGDFDPSNPDIRFSQNQAPVTGESVRDMARALEQEYGLDKLSMFHRQTSNTIVVSNIAVPRESQGSGIGTAVMHRIADYADQHGARIALSPGLSDGDLGTTSRARLVRFYKRFGFVENKGRNKDFALSEGMYREPAAGGATSPAALFSQEPASETQEKVSKIQEKAAAARKHVRRWLKRNLTKEGLMNKATFEIKLKSDAIKNVGEEEIAYYVHHYEKALKEAYGVGHNEFSKADTDAMHAYLIGEKDVQLPAVLKEALDNMRSHLDSLSGEMISSIEDIVAIQVSELSPAQRERYQMALDTNGTEGDVPEHIMSSLSMMQTISNNVGAYLNRSYQAFDDVDWKEKALADKPLIAEAEAFIRENNQHLSDDEVKGAVRAILQSAKDNGNFMSMIASGTKVGSKDISITRRRKDVPESIRRLLGEYKDPKLNFARSASKMQWYVANHHFLKNLREAGLNNFLFTKPTGEFDTQIASDGSQTMNPLNGLYTTEDFRQGMEDVMDKFDGSDLMRTIIRLNSVVKYGKTILSPTTQARNFMSAFFFRIMNGHFDPRYEAKAFRAIKAGLFTHDGDSRAYINDLIARGVIHDNPYSSELKAALNDMMELDTYKKGATQSARKFLGFMQKVYQASDDYHKIVGYENQVASFEKSGMPTEEARNKAAYRIRNGYPTYSMVPRAVKKLRRWPLIGTFVSFPYEAMRTTYNQVEFIREDLQEGRKAEAARRMAGFAIASASAYAVSKLSMLLMGMDDDDDEAVRAQLPEWSRNSQLYYIGYDEDGLPIYMDLSYLDPYTYLKKPLTALTNGNNDGIGKKVLDAMTEMAEPFIGTDIAAGAILEIWSNKKSSGGQVYNPEDSGYRQAKDILNHARKAVQPGAMSNIERTILAIQGESTDSGMQYKIKDEALAWIGFRVGTLNLSQSLIYKAYGFSDSKRSATSILSRVAGSQRNVSMSELDDAYESMISARERAYGDMIKLIGGARTLGVTDRGIRQSLAGANLSQEDISYLLRGQTPRWKMSAEFIKSATDRAVASSANEQKKRDIRAEMLKRRIYISQLNRISRNIER